MTLTLGLVVNPTAGKGKAKNAGTPQGRLR